MLGKILNLNGVIKLGRTQQKKINGGFLQIAGFEDSECRIKLTLSDGTFYSYIKDVGGNSNSSIDTAASTECAGAMANFGAPACHYNCAYDGFDQ
jgi:hypothetical protein